MRASVACRLGTACLANGRFDEGERYLREAQAATRSPALQARISTAIEMLAPARAAAERASRGAGPAWWLRLVRLGAISAALGGSVTYVVMTRLTSEPAPTHQAAPASSIMLHVAGNRVNVRASPSPDAPVVGTGRTRPATPAARSPRRLARGRPFRCRQRANGVDPRRLHQTPDWAGRPRSRCTVTASRRQVAW